MFKRKKKDRGNNPMIFIATLINQYHAIDHMCGTKEEKEWAKARLEKKILNKSKNLSNTLITQLKSSMKSKYVWEVVKNQYLD